MTDFNITDIPNYLLINEVMLRYSKSMSDDEQLLLRLIVLDYTKQLQKLKDEGTLEVYYEDAIPYSRIHGTLLPETFILRQFYQEGRLPLLDRLILLGTFANIGALGGQNQPEKEEKSAHERPEPKKFGSK